MTPQAPDRIGQVRHLVRGLLERTDAFSQLSEPERRSVATSLVKIMGYLADPYAGIDRPAAGPPRPAAGPARPAVGPPLAAAQASGSGQEEFAPNKELRDRLAKRGPTAGQDFVGGATQQMGDTFKDIVKAVDFPRFVSGLIEGVFSSIVKSTIKQMQAFQQMLEGIAKSVDQFAKETISDATAREYLQNAYPRALTTTIDDDGGARLSLRDDLEDADRPDLKADLGMQEDASLDDRESEAKVVFAAQRKLAKQRQQHLATMVLMGINRIIVTEGEIKASVLFDVKSKDRVQRDRFAQTSDTRVQNKLRTEGGGWFDDSYEQETEMRVASALSNEKEQSVSELEAKAKLTGSVTVKFKSETFPLERFASSDMLGFVNEKGSA